MRIILILLLIFCFTAISQNKLPSEYIFKGDTLVLEVNNIGCNVYHNHIFKISKSKDSLIQIGFQSYHTKEYYYEKNDVAKYHKDSTRVFLKRNNIKINQRYNVSQRPLKEEVGWSQGITRHEEQDIETDSIAFYPLPFLNEIDTLYNKIIDNKLHQECPCIAGDWTKFNLYSINNWKRTYYIKDKETKGWYMFLISSKKLRN